MKNLLLTLGLVLFSFPGSSVLMAQCTPADSITCPDTTGKGAICPDTLKTAYLEQAYEQVVTMIIPTTYDTGIYSVPLHHIQLKKVDGLPPGISWETNSENNIFLAGKYYCIDFKGTPTKSGHFPLKVYVDIYSSYNDVAILLGQTIDSTSLWIDVLKANAVLQHPEGENVFKAWPNPFQNTLHLNFISQQPEAVRVDIFNLLGQKIYHQEFKTVAGRNSIPVNCNLLPSQTLIIRLQQNSRVLTTIVNKKP